MTLHKIPRDHMDATKERLRHAGTNASIGENGVRYITDTPLQRLANGGKLSGDADQNRRLLEAGERYYRDWYLSGMDTLAAMDMSREGGAGGGARAHLNDAQADYRANFRAAYAELGAKLRAVVDPVVLHEQADLVALGYEVTVHKDRKAARAVAFDRLVMGLETLVRHYRMNH